LALFAALRENQGFSIRSNHRMTINVQTPDWVKNAVFYQIFPDRFRRSDQTRHARGIKLKPWGAPPEEQGYQGGDLYGVVEKLDYLKDLGVTAIYLNPIFSAASNHRYNAYNFLEVDPLLGGEAAFRALLDEAHKRDMKVVIDGVFNHCGRGFWAFHHIIENGGDSPYIDWFHVQQYPLYAYPCRGRPAAQLRHLVGARLPAQIQHRQPRRARLHL
jgi:cyclomaltodextrinase / maltogenic alpha-amylase / neopullulanase